MKKQITKISIVIVMIITMAFMITFNENYKESITISSNALSNKKIGWGIKREKDHVQPDLGSKNKEMMDKYKGIAMGNKEQKYVYLTFDEGYEAGYTPRILQILKENNVKATFFLTAHYINTRRGLSKRND